MNYSKDFSSYRQYFYNKKCGKEKPAKNHYGIHWSFFHSKFGLSIQNSNLPDLPDIFMDSLQNQELNNHFIYPVIIPKDMLKYSKAIILVHGLNERFWDKYLPWAIYLSELTNRPVILFPIANHINRSPQSWHKARIMTPYVSKRQFRIKDLSQLSFANIALSERLSSHPERFFLSGYHAAQDIVQLVSQIHSGEHPLFNENTQINFFAYSIGVLLSQVLLLTNPGKIFSDSKFFFFCGGSVFEEMRGNSKLILDEFAFSNILKFYCHATNNKAVKSDIFSNLLFNTAFGNTFLNLTSFARFNSIKKNIFKDFQEKLLTICLKKDKVIPYPGIKKTMMGTKVEIRDFPFNYTHETPFPLFNDEKTYLVDKSFREIFQLAGAFLN